MSPSMQFTCNSSNGFSSIDIIRTESAAATEAEYKQNNLNLQSEVKLFKYSPLGNHLVAVLPTMLQLYKTRGEELKLHLEIPMANIIDFSFSPSETFLTVLARYGTETPDEVKPKEGEPAYKNLFVYDLETGSLKLSFTQKNLGDWNIEWTGDESHCAKLSSANELQFFDSKNFENGVSSRLKLENIESFSVSPGKRPIVALFMGGKNGAPSSTKIYDITNLEAPLSQKSFFRADRVTFHWNNIGTNVLVFTHTDVDATGKSYYGETSLYYLSISANYECRVDLGELTPTNPAQPGPIHDVAWSPNAKEFIVTYGSMPARSTVFDHRAQPMYELGTGARNTVRYSGSGRFFFIAGFGNLAGDMGFKKVSTIAATNSSTCEWGPDGRHIMTGILYRRLKVDNGLRIWHYTGGLAFQLESKEMYQVAWRPEGAAVWPERSGSSPTPVGILPPAPAIGKYRPPGARSSPYVETSSYDRAAIDRGEMKKKKRVPGATSSVHDVPEVIKPAVATQGAIVGGMLDVEKKIKGINKKLQQIQGLKEKKANGVELELTQLSKILSEAGLITELAALMIKSS